MAVVGQTVSHARQYMQAFSAKGSDLSYSFRLLPGPFELGPSCGLRFQPKTRTGHALMHAPSAMQRSKSTATYVPWIQRYPFYSMCFSMISWSCEFIPV